MKALRCCFIGIFFLAWLPLMEVAYAETDLLNLDSYAEGSNLPYGSGVVVGMVESTGVKYITGAPKQSGKLKFEVNLAGEFEVTFLVLEYYCCTENFNLFLTSDEHQIKVSFYGGGSVELSADTQSGNDASNAFKKDLTNSFRLAVSNNVAKLYVNDVFSQKVTLTPGLTYTQLLIAGLESSDAMTVLETSGGATGTGTTPPTGGGDFESGKQAGIQQCQTDPTSCGISVTSGGTHANFNPTTGELYIPLVDVPGAFGIMQTYEVYMVQQPSTFTFDLDMNRVKAVQ